jgi:ketosteroid isomerase-like protein
MVDKATLQKLREVYAAWNERQAGALDLFRELMDEKFVLTSMNESTPGLAFAVDRDSREDALAYLGGIFDEWEMVHYTPDTFVNEGDNVAVFGTCCYRYKKTGNEADCRIACLWRFRDGKAIEMTDIWDTAVAAAATVA